MQQILPEELCDFNYYVSKCPQYLQNDECFIEHFRIWYDFLVGTDEDNGILNSSHNMLSFVNIFDKTYLERLAELPGDVSFDMLNKLGSIFNVQRNFAVTYIDGQSVTKQLSLNDEDFITLIRARVIKNYSNGSYEQMKEFYDSADLQVVFTSPSPAAVNCYLLVSDGSSTYDYSDDVIDMFKAGMLTIESMGIGYSYAKVDYNVLLFWKVNDDGTVEDEHGWDLGEWSI